MSPVYKYSLPVAFDGFETVKDVDVSIQMTDAQDALWALYDIDGTEIVGACAPISAVTVRLTVDPALPVGDYQLVGLQ